MTLCEMSKLFCVAGQEVVEVLMMEGMSVMDLRMVARPDFGVLAKMAMMDVCMMLRHVSFSMLDC
jgi:hypothetical protein